MAALQCCLGFCVQCSESALRMHVSPLVRLPLSWASCTVELVPTGYLLTCGSARTSIPTSQSIPRHLPAPGPPIHPLPVSLFLPCKRVHLSAHCSTIYNSQDTKANSHWQMNGQKRRYTWNLTQPLKRNGIGSFVDWANLEPENPICFHKERSSVVDLNYGSGFLIDISPAQVPMSPLSSPSPKPCPSISLPFFLITAS